MEPVTSGTGGPSQYTPEDEALFSKVIWRLMPLLVVCYMIAFLDRINIGYAELQMKEDLGFSEVAFAIGASIFFVGYFIFEVPSNMLLEKIGARKTLLRIMFCWGIVAAAMAFVESATTFYILRFLLGAFEAGFFPGVILYLTYWFPSARRGRVIAIFLTATALAYVIAGPISGAILQYMDGLLNLTGWQWLFVVQGLPASILGIVVYFWLTDRPEQASWLTQDEKARLRDHLDHDAHALVGGHHATPWSLFRDPKVYLLVLVYFLFLGATYSMLFWAPTLIQSWGVEDLFMVGVLGAIPAILSAIGMVLIGRSSDKRMERRWHFFAASLICAAGITLTIFTEGLLVASLIGLCIMAIGQGSTTPLFFTAVSEYFPVASAAVGLAVVSSLGNLGPAVMPPILAWVGTVTGSQAASLAVIAALYVVAALVLVAAIRPETVVSKSLS
ncbi:MAG: MFS transporter [Actinomycetia bacterium]|nr:MFS transporter [Actinomycetes bacterium]